MSTYKDDLDILKAAEKADINKLTFNAITELDNKGLLGRYGGEGGGGAGPVEWDFLAELAHDGGEVSANLLAGDYFETRRKVESETDESLNIGALVRTREYLRVTVMVEPASPGEDYLEFIVLGGKNTYIIRWFSDNTLTITKDDSGPGLDPTPGR